MYVAVVFVVVALSLMEKPIIIIMIPRLVSTSVRLFPSLMVTFLVFVVIIRPLLIDVVLVFEISQRHVVVSPMMAFVAVVFVVISGLHGLRENSVVLVTSNSFLSLMMAVVVMIKASIVAFVVMLTFLIRWLKLPPIKLSSMEARMVGGAGYWFCRCRWE